MAVTTSYKQAHNGGKKRQKSTGSAVDLSVNVDDYSSMIDVKDCAID